MNYRIRIVFPSVIYNSFFSSRPGQSLDDPALAFIVVDPLIARADYRIGVTLEDLKLIKASSVSNVEVHAIVEMNQDFGKTTVNLKGPIIINKKEGLGHQFILKNSTYSTKEKLHLEK